MYNLLKVTAVLALALVPVAHLAAQAAPSRDQQAQFEQEATKTCNYDLEHDRFGSYGSMDECISDHASKLARKEAAKSATANSGVTTHQPN